MKGVLKNIILLLVTGIICLVILEGFFRLTTPERSLNDLDDELVYKPITNYQGVSKNVEFDRKYWTNSEGFVEQNPSREKANGTTRIFLVGDSFVEGLYTSRDKHFPALLENRLNKTGQYEILSYGVTSWGTGNEYKYITSYALNYSPDIIVLLYFYNDLENALNSPLYKVENDSIVPIKLNPRLGKKILTGCSIYSSLCAYIQLHAGSFNFMRPLLHWMGFTISGSISSGDFNIDPYLLATSQEAKTSIEEAWKKTSLLLKAIKQSAGNREAKFFIVYVPSKLEAQLPQQQLFKTTYNFSQQQVNFDAIRLRLNQTAAENEIPFFDPTETYRQKESRSEKLYTPIMHFTEAGDALMAEVLYDALDSGFLK